MASVTAGVYARQSHGKQVSLEDQIREAHATCVRESWTQVAYSDKVSASRFGTKERGDWSQLCVDITAGKLNILVLWASDRGDRTAATWLWFLEQCRKHKVRIYVIRDRHLYDLDVPRDWKSLADSGVDAQHESELKSVDVRRGTAGAAMAGKPHGHVAYGYSRIYDSADRKKFRDVPNEHAATARSIIEQVAAEVPLKRIVDRLNDAGVPAPEGGKWTSKTVKKLATRPKYIGLRQHNGQLYPGQWESLVTETLFRRAGAVLSAPGRQSSPPGATKHLLSYLVSCGKCEAGMNVQPPREGRVARYRCVGKGCTSVEQAHLDTYVTEVVLERLSREDARVVFAPDTAITSRLREVIANARDELEELSARVGRKELTLEFAAMTEPAIRERLNDALAGLKRHAENAALLDLLDSDDLWGTWRGMPVPARRSVVKALFATISLAESPVRLTRWTSDEDKAAVVAERTTVEWVTKSAR
ncbi:recombinase family protein [Actinophytocola sp.]|uniref:recombinase family protein n=1 Tax=Actinophytocola sp. TaxID=1872138 RepID=UPI003D6C5D95